jgi:urease accessory protein
VALLSDCIRFGVAPSDGVALACAHRAAGPGGLVDRVLVTRADERLTAGKLAREAREASTRTGRALLSTATAAFGGAAMLDYAEQVDERRSPGNHAVVLGLLSAQLGVPRLEAVVGDLYAFSASWVAAAVRLALTDHRTAQGLLHRVRSVTAKAVAGLRAALESCPNVLGGVSELPNGCGVAVRLHGSTSKAVQTARAAAWNAGRLELLGTPAPTLRKGSPGPLSGHPHHRPFAVTWLMWAVITPAYRGGHGRLGGTTGRTTRR